MSVPHPFDPLNPREIAKVWKQTKTLEREISDSGLRLRLLYAMHFPDNPQTSE